MTTIVVTNPQDMVDLEGTTGSNECILDKIVCVSRFHVGETCEGEYFFDGNACHGEKITTPNERWFSQAFCGGALLYDGICEK